jgi:hypothetical protein
MLLFCVEKKQYCSNYASNFTALKKIQQLPNITVEMQQDIELYNICISKISKFYLNILIIEM